jgi:hypothetical protein
MPFIKTVHYFMSDRSAEQLPGNPQRDSGRCRGLQYGINFWLSPAYSWHGAVWSSFVSDGLLATAIAFTAILLTRRSILLEAYPAHSSV